MPMLRLCLFAALLCLIAAIPISQAQADATGSTLPPCDQSSATSKPPCSTDSKSVTVPPAHPQEHKSVITPPRMPQEDQPDRTMKPGADIHQPTPSTKQ
ncbi:MAG TPA: hypothetical protein VN023_09885 [Methylovorus sp.]|nr:hypothetical protein [Methylovorus sp.]